MTSSNYNGWHNGPAGPYYSQSNFGLGAPNTDMNSMPMMENETPPARENPSFIEMMENLISASKNKTESRENNVNSTANSTIASGVNLTRETSEDRRNGNFMDMIRTQVESLFRAFIPNRSIRNGNLTANENNFRKLLRQRYQLRNSLFREEDNNL